MKSIVLSASQNPTGEHDLTFEFLLHNGIIRRFQFIYMDCEIVNPIFQEDECSFVQVKPKIMIQLLEHLHRSPEIIVTASPMAFSVHSYHALDNSLILKQSAKEVMNTGLTIQIAEFDAYDFHSPQGVEEFIFCVKEVVAFVGFCEAIDLVNLDLFFSSGGRAIKFRGRQDFVAVSLVLATFENPNPNYSNPSPNNPIPPARLPPQPTRTTADQSEDDAGNAEESYHYDNQPMTATIPAIDTVRPTTASSHTSNTSSSTTVQQQSVLPPPPVMIVAEGYESNFEEPLAGLPPLPAHRHRRALDDLMFPTTSSSQLHQHTNNQITTTTITTTIHHHHPNTSADLPTIPEDVRSISTSTDAQHSVVAKEKKTKKSSNSSSSNGDEKKKPMHSRKRWLEESSSDEEDW